ncbi:hypothetical protein I7I48_11753 [Histoplasma ohiense]|nr:hypothetical protein I7I48_11753 [Histoplasma ohiense (nom. inval.)]
MSMTQVNALLTQRTVRFMIMLLEEKVL